MIARIKNLPHYLVLLTIFFIPLAWSRQLNANYVSAKFFLVYFISSFSLILISKTVKLPKLPVFLMTCLAVIVGLQFSTLFIAESWISVFYLFKFFSFVFFTYYFFSQEIKISDVKNFSILILVTSALVLYFAGADFYKFRIEASNLQSGFLLGSFGNVNMMSEFLILTLPLIFLWLKAEDSIAKLIKYVVFVGWIFFIMYGRSRSAWIGLFVWSLWQIYQGNRKQTLIPLLIAYLIYAVALYTPSTGPQANEVVKGNSFAERVALYKSSAQLILNNPIGVGVGQFENKAIPYLLKSDLKPSDMVYFDQPHSELIKWGVQFGWLGILLPLLIFGFIAKKIFWPIDKKNSFLIESLFVAAPQIAFQFPFENPTSLMYLAFVFALFLGLYSVKTIRVHFAVRGLIYVISFVGMLHAVFFVRSIYFESTQPNDYEKVDEACEIYPINMNACFLRDYLLINKNEMQLAKKNLEEHLLNYPYHRGLLRLLPVFLKNTSTVKNTCEAILQYNLLFVNQYFFEPAIIKSCSEFKAPVQYLNPEQFQRDYSAWLKSIL